MLQVVVPSNVTNKYNYKGDFIMLLHEDILESIEFGMNELFEGEFNGFMLTIIREDDNVIVMIEDEDVYAVHKLSFDRFKETLKDESSIKTLIGSVLYYNGQSKEVF